MLRKNEKGAFHDFNWDEAFSGSKLTIETL